MLAERSPESGTGIGLEIQFVGQNIVEEIRRGHGLTEAALLIPASAALQIRLEPGPMSDYAVPAGWAHAYVRQDLRANLIKAATGHHGDDLGHLLTQRARPS